MNRIPRDIKFEEALIEASATVMDYAQHMILRMDTLMIVNQDHLAAKSYGTSHAMLVLAGHFAANREDAYTLAQGQKFAHTLMDQLLNYGKLDPKAVMDALRVSQVANGRSSGIDYRVYQALQRGMEAVANSTDERHALIESYLDLLARERGDKFSTNAALFGAATTAN